MIFLSQAQYDALANHPHYGGQTMSSDITRDNLDAYCQCDKTEVPHHRKVSDEEFDRLAREAGYAPIAKGGYYTAAAIEAVSSFVSSEDDAERLLDALSELRLQP